MRGLTQKNTGFSPNFLICVESDVFCVTHATRVLARDKGESEKRLITQSNLVSAENYSAAWSLSTTRTLAFWSALGCTMIWPSVPVIFLASQDKEWWHGLRPGLLLQQSQPHRRHVYLIKPETPHVFRPRLGIKVSGMLLTLQFGSHICQEYKQSPTTVLLTLDGVRTGWGLLSLSSPVTLNVYYLKFYIESFKVSGMKFTKESLVIALVPIY